MILLPFRDWHERWAHIFETWGDKGFNFLRDDLPRLITIIVLTLIFWRLLVVVTRHVERLSRRHQLPTGMRAQQLRTMAGVVRGVGVFFIIFNAAIQILRLVDINVGPLLASAGVVGLAVGFGAQTLVKDVINGFFILMENTYDVGDTVKIGGVQGTVEMMTLRRTILRDADGTVHTIPNSTIAVVSNLTRDWTQATLHVSIDYKEDSDKVCEVLTDAARQVHEDPKFAEVLVADPVVHGIDRVHGNEVEYLVTLRTRPGQQFGVARELRRLIKAALERNNIEPGGRRYFLDAQQPAAK